MSLPTWREELDAALRDIEQAKKEVAFAASVYRALIITCVKETGNVTEAAQLLGLSRQTVHRHINTATI